MTPPPAHLPRRRGFSLVELTLTAVIVGLVAAVAVPRYAASLHNARLDAAARRLVADFAHARQHALATSATVRLEFDLTHHTLTSPDLPALNDPAAAFVTDYAADPYAVRFTAAAFDAAPTCAFDGYGRPEAGGSVTLRSGGDSITVTLDAETGEAVRP
jgi:prepilin-type N-terminal cleavage/methylation domain-containing protein